MGVHMPMDIAEDFALQVYVSCARCAGQRNDFELTPTVKGVNHTSVEGSCGIGGMVQEKEVDSAPAIGLCCTHNAPVRCVLGLLFRKVMQKH